MDVTYPLRGCDDKGLPLCDVLSTARNPSLIMRKTSDKPRLGCMLQDTRPTALLLTAKVMKKQGTTKTLSQAKGDWGDMTTKYDAITRIESWNRKRSVKSK